MILILLLPFKILQQLWIFCWSNLNLFIKLTIFSCFSPCFPFSNKEGVACHLSKNPSLHKDWLQKILVGKWEFSFVKWVEFFFLKSVLFLDCFVEEKSFFLKPPLGTLMTLTTDASFKKSLPGQVRAPAVFRCHRVTAISSGEGELAYQATVNIGGHVFKGFLYDQGVDDKNAFPSLSHLHLESGNHHRE